MAIMVAEEAMASVLDDRLELLKQELKDPFEVHPDAYVFI